MINWKKLIEGNIDFVVPLNLCFIQNLNYFGHLLLLVECSFLDYNKGKYL